MIRAAPDMAKVVSLIFACLAFIFPVTVVGQGLPREASESDATTRVRASVAAQLRSGALPSGHYRADALTEFQSGVGQAKQRRNWFGRHPVLTGALIGAGVGATLGATGDTEPGTSKPATVALTTAVGAGVGALIGRLFR